MQLKILIFICPSSSLFLTETSLLLTNLHFFLLSLSDSLTETSLLLTQNRTHIMMLLSFKDKRKVTKENPLALRAHTNLIKVSLFGAARLRVSKKN